MNKYIAYCGLDCETCEARTATIKDSDALRRKVAEKWSKLNKTRITPEMINCTGCRIEGVKTPFCDKMCRIRQCARASGVETCGECEKAETCEKLAVIVRNDPSVLQNLKNII